MVGLRETAKLTRPWNAGRRGWIDHLAVASDVRRNGHGRTMAQTAEVSLRERGVPKLNPMVRGDNQAIRDFHQTIGHDSDDGLVFSRRPREPA